MSTQYWEEEIEIMSREKLQELQLQRLKKTINIAANSLQRGFHQKRHHRR